MVQCSLEAGRREPSNLEPQTFKSLRTWHQKATKESTQHQDAEKQGAVEEDQDRSPGPQSSSPLFSGLGPVTLQESGLGCGKMVISLLACSSRGLLRSASCPSVASRVQTVCEGVGIYGTGAWRDPLTTAGDCFQLQGTPLHGDPVLGLRTSYFLILAIAVLKPTPYPRRSGDSFNRTATPRKQTKGQLRRAKAASAREDPATPRSPGAAARGLPTARAPRRSFRWV